MLTDEHLLIEKPHAHIGGTLRVYRFPCGNGLSLINSPMAHAYPFAWEAAVLTEVADDGGSFSLTYDTPLTNDVEVFDTDEETNAFIERAAEYFASVAA